MKVLLIEDVEVKRNQIKKFLHEIVKCEIIEATNFKEGSLLANSLEYDLALVDMALPTYNVDDGNNGGAMRHLGGRDIISKIHRRKLGKPAIIITRFDSLGPAENKISISDLDIKLSNDFPGTYWGYVFYDDQSESSWKNNLKKLIANLEIER